jgi:translation initiation factor 5A
MDSTQDGDDVTHEQASNLHEGDFIVIRNRPCKIVETSHIKTGKHGSAKCNITGIDIFNGKKYKIVCGAKSNVDVPLITRTEYQFIDLNESTLSFLNDSKIDEIQVPPERLDEIKKKYLSKDDDQQTVCIVNITSAMGERSIA